MLFYRIFQWLLRLATRVFFRRIEIVGLGNLPREGAVLFCGNHPNSLLDPILITAHCGRIVHFAAKDKLFESPLMGALLRRMGAVPIKRRMDHPGQESSNDAAFAALHQVLLEGRAVGIFPEGLSHLDSQLAPLKTGAARIALAVVRKAPERRSISSRPGWSTSRATASAPACSSSSARRWRPSCRRPARRPSAPRCGR